MDIVTPEEIERIRKLAPWADWVPADGPLSIDEYLEHRAAAKAAGDAGKYELVEGWLFVTRYEGSYDDSEDVAPTGGTP